VVSFLQTFCRQIRRERAACPPQVRFLGSVCVLAALLFTSCSSASPPIAQATSTLRGTSAAGSAVTPRPTSSATGGPAPITAPLAPPPPNCALTPPPQRQQLAHLGANHDVQLVGGGPFWLYDGSYQSVLHLGPTGYSQWPQWKWVVEVGPSYSQSITLRLQNQQTGGLAWWTDAQAPPGTATQTLLLDPQTDFIGRPSVPAIPHGVPDPAWKEWGVFPLFDVAGCYALGVSWAGGSWKSIFAVGN
jgi:hypothetical protein